MRIRPATLDDAQAIMEIYNHYVRESTSTFDLVPRSLEEQRSWLSDRFGARFVIVAVADDGEGDADAKTEDANANANKRESVCGFAATSQYKDRAAYATTVEDSVYVAPAFHGMGVGRALLTSLVDTARSHGFHSMIARIVGDHAASISLHHSCGFEVIGHEREVGRKFGQWLDVIVMQRML